jgi:hypothetical protein
MYEATTVLMLLFKITVNNDNRFTLTYYYYV